MKRRSSAFFAYIYFKCAHRFWSQPKLRAQANPSIAENLCFRKLNEMRSNVNQTWKYDDQIHRRDKIYQSMYILFIKKYWKNKKVQSNDKNTCCKMTVVGIISTKEIKSFTPLLKIWSVAKDPNFAFPFKMVWEKMINHAVWRHFLGKNEKKNFGTNHFFGRLSFW